MATKRKARRYDGEDGSYVEDSESLADENYGDGTTREERLAMVRSPRKAAMPAADESAMESNVGQGKYAAPAKKSFKDAFAEARKGGGKSFEWEGKKYTTEMAGAKGAPKAEQASARRVDNDMAARASRNTRTGPTADELESYAASKKAAPAKTGVDAIPTSGYRKVEGGEKIDSSEVGRNVKNTLNALAPIGGGVGKIGAELATAGRGTKAAGKAAEVASKGREEVTNPLMWAAGPKNAGKFKEGAKTTSKKAKKAMDESDTTGGAVGYKKGGNVKGWGIARGARKAKIV